MTDIKNLSLEELRNIFTKEFGASVFSRNWRSKPDEFLIVDQTITTGGMSGGNCWGDEATSFTTGEMFDDVDGMLFKFIEKYWPDINWVQAQKMIAIILSVEETSETEYYGNYTKYSSRVIDIRKLKDFIDSQ